MSPRQPLGVKLYPFQQEVLGALAAAREEGHTRLAGVAATGLGKTTMFVEDISRRASQGPELTLVHRDELAQQAMARFKLQAPHLSVGLVKAENNDWKDRDVVVGSVQTLARRNRREALPDSLFKGITIDECHHAPAAGYMSIIEYFGAFDDRRTPVTGWTATFSRSDSKALGRVFQRVVNGNDHDILFGIRNGFLRDVRGLAMVVDGLDLASVALRAGDLADASLADALEACDAGRDVALGYLDKARHPLGPRGLRQGLGFAPTVESTLYFARAFNAAGIPSAAIIGDTDPDDRKKIYAAINSGELQVIWSCGVLTEGFDLPALSCAIMARPTMSQGLYIQMAGRVLRIDRRPGMSFAPGLGPISDALLLDVCGVTRLNGLQGLASLTLRQVQPKDGESLAEAVRRETEEYERDRERYDRQRPEWAVQYEEVDLFKASHSAWLQTLAGVYFIPAGSRTWFLWPGEVAEDGSERWKVGWYEGYSMRVRGWSAEGMSLPLEMAMGLAEAEAGEWEPTVSQRTASWRTRRQAPSDGQMSMADRMRIKVPPGTSRAELSDMLSIAIASRTLDKVANKRRSKA